MPASGDSQNASVQTRHVAILGAILVAILLAILVLLPLLILNSRNIGRVTAENNMPKLNDYTDKSDPTRELLRGISVGSKITIKGRVNRNPKCFAIQLLMRDGFSVALHLNPRFNWKGDVNVFARNSFLSGSWGVEERKMASFPFAPGLDFEMVIWCGTDAFHVTVNNGDQVDYTYRVGLETIVHVRVRGDMTLLDVSNM